MMYTFKCKAAGDVIMTITGSLYVLEGTIQPEVKDAPVPPELEAPKPGAKDNPFKPIEGQPAP